MTGGPWFAWDASRASEAVEALVAAARLPLPPRTSALAPLPKSDRAALGRWIDAAAATIGLESEPLRATHKDIPAVVRTGGPAILYLTEPKPCVVALLDSRRGRSRVATPDHGVSTIASSEIEDALWAPIYREYGARADAILERANVPPSRRARARVSLLREPYGSAPIDAGWTLRIPPSAPIAAQASAAGLPRAIVATLAFTIASHILSLVGWWLVGRGALGGTLDKGWLIAWALLLLTLVPVRVAASWWQGLLGVGASALLKRRLLVGALRLDPEEVRGEGTGQILGRVIESEAVESLVLGGGFGAVLAGVELAMAAPVLAISAGGLVAAVALVAWTAFALFLSWGFAKRSQEWATARVRMTDDLVERMVGHRTRLAQEPPETWHDDEDRALSNYVGRSARLDLTSTLFGGLLTRGWTILGMLSLVPGFLAGGTTSSAIAIGIGGVLLARGAFGRLAGGMASLANAQVAWRQVAPIFRSAARPEIVGSPTAHAVDARERHDDEPLLVAHDIVFRYRAQGDAALRKVTLRIGARDRVLLEGPSGGGKSTLGSVITGLRTPESGLLLLDGLDRHTLGASGWRRRVVAAPQFHENHVLSNTLLFNLLMGREWPPRGEDVEEAIEVARELGLGPLLERMPASIAQMVGETGWQLSHGEQSRLFIARALLQGARLIVLDESFAALDPETLGRALRCVMKRAPALVVIAHP